MGSHIKPISAYMRRIGAYDVNRWYNAVTFCPVLFTDGAFCVAKHSQSLQRREEKKGKEEDHVSKSIYRPEFCGTRKRS